MENENLEIPPDSVDSRQKCSNKIWSILKKANPYSLKA